MTHLKHSLAWVSFPLCQDFFGSGFLRDSCEADEAQPDLISIEVKDATISKRDSSSYGGDSHPTQTHLPRSSRRSLTSPHLNTRI